MTRVPLYSSGLTDKDQPERLDRYWREWRGACEGRMAEYQILRTQYRVSDFVSWQRSGLLKLNPNFQRRSVWKKGAKSYLMDTIVRGLSMPIIFLRDVPADLQTLESRRDVVDGQQRLRTVLAYVDPTLLKDFDAARDDFCIEAVHNADLGGLKFSQLPPPNRQRILDYQFSVHVFPADTDDREVLQIFARMNATGTKLNGQELRNAEFFGQFKTVAYNLATEQLNRWRDWRVFNSDQIARMDEVELTSEFLMAIMDGVLEKEASMIGAFYRDFDKEFADKEEVSSRYRLTMDRLDATFRKDMSIFRNRTMFYALFTTVYGLQYGLTAPPKLRRPPAGWLLKNHQSLPRRTPRPLRKEMTDQIRQAGQAIKDGTAPEEVLRATRGSTSHANTRRTLIGYLAGAADNPCPPLP